MNIPLVGTSTVGGLWSSVLHMPTIAAVLMVVGFTLLIAEIFVPGFGVCGGLGFASLFFAVLFTAKSVTEGLILVIILFVITALFLGGVFYAASHGKLSKNLILRESTANAAGFSGTDHYEAFLGKQGLAETPLRPAGIVRIGEKRVDVVTQGEFLPTGSAVEVIETAGNRVVVRAMPSVEESRKY